MNFVGKIFVMLILVMSLVFMSFAIAVYSTHRNWKEEAKDLERQRVEVEARNNELNQTLENLKTEMATEQQAAQAQIAKLETMRDALQKQRASDEQRLAQLVGQNTELTGTVGATQQRLTALLQEVSQLRQEIIVAQTERDRLFADVLETTEQLHDSHAQLVRAKETQLQLARDVARYKQAVEGAGIDPEAPTDGAPPEVQGQVTQVSGNRLIEVSLGSDDGLRTSHTVHVYRGNSYLGKAEILRTAPDRAVGRILKPYQKGAIRKGDRVATRLKIS